jgi:hypothetical protein
VKHILQTTILTLAMLLSSLSAVASSIEVSGNNTAGVADVLQKISDLVGPAMLLAKKTYDEAGGANTTQSSLTLVGPMIDYIASATLEADYNITIIIKPSASQTKDASGAAYYGPQFMGGKIFQFIPVPSGDPLVIVSWGCITNVDSGLTNPIAVNSPSRVTRMQSQIDGTSLESVNLNPVLSSCIYVGDTLP